MNCRTIVRSLKSDHFTKITNKGNWLDDGAIIYAKEIKENIFLLFIIMKGMRIENIQALIAHFDGLNSIGQKAPEQIMFYLSIKDKEDFHYFEKYLKTTDN